MMWILLLSLVLCFDIDCAAPKPKPKPVIKPQGAKPGAQQHIAKPVANVKPKPQPKPIAQQQSSKPIAKPKPVTVQNISINNSEDDQAVAIINGILGIIANGVNIAHNHNNHAAQVQAGMALVQHFGAILSNALRYPLDGTGITEDGTQVNTTHAHIKKLNLVSIKKILLLIEQMKSPEFIEKLCAEIVKKRNSVRLRPAEKKL